MRLQALKILVLSVFITTISHAQSYIVYDISFDNAMQHEAEVKVSFTKIKKGKFLTRLWTVGSGSSGNLLGKDLEDIIEF